MKRRLGDAITVRTLTARTATEGVEVLGTRISADASGSAAPASGIPTAFISYSWDSSDHQEWVLQIAEKLTRDGVKVILDRWHLGPGGDRAQFMESGVRDSDFVLVICTPEYSKKATARVGGVGYEAMIITAELARQILQRKFIPVLRSGEWGPMSQPLWIESKLGVDLRGGTYREDEYERLLRCYTASSSSRPRLGRGLAFLKGPRHASSRGAPQRKFRIWPLMSRLSRVAISRPVRFSSRQSFP